MEVFLYKKGSTEALYKAPFSQESLRKSSAAMLQDFAVVECGLSFTKQKKLGRKMYGAEQDYFVVFEDSEPKFVEIATNKVNSLAVTLFVVLPKNLIWVDCVKSNRGLDELAYNYTKLSCLNIHAMFGKETNVFYMNNMGGYDEFK